MKTATKARPRKTKASRGIRFKPDIGMETLALLDATKPSKTKPFLATHMAIVVNESFKGCGLVLAMSPDFKAGSRCRVKVGRGPVLEAEIRWRTDLDSEVMRLGLLYME